jgi:hypothetical protein
MADTVFGFDATYWYNKYTEEQRLSFARGRKACDQAVRLGRQRRTIIALKDKVAVLEQALSEAQNTASHAPVINEDTSTLEERVNKLERIVAEHTEHLRRDDKDLGKAFHRLNELEYDAKRRRTEPTLYAGLGDVTVDSAAAILTKAVSEALTLTNRAGRKNNVS